MRMESSPAPPPTLSAEGGATTCHVSTPTKSSPFSPFPKIAEKFIIMYEECLEVNYQSIQRLKDNPPPGGVKHIRQEGNDNDDMTMRVLIRNGSRCSQIPFECIE